MKAECAQGKMVSRALSKVTGFALGLAGVPAGGLAGRAVGYATNPDCGVIRPVAAPTDQQPRLAPATRQRAG